MQRIKGSRADLYNLDNCFGFSEDDINLLLWERSSTADEPKAPLEFQSNKPYRLALYVRQSEQKRLQRSKASLQVKNTVEKQKANKSNDPLFDNQTLEVKRSSRINKKVKLMLFDENVNPEHVSEKVKMTAKLKPNKNLTIEGSSIKETVLREVNTKPFSRTKQSKIRKSYERKFKEKDESENIPEPPSEQILQELEFKKLSRTKQNKIAKEEQEFEKWANNMNSAFDDVEKFELSIAYD